MMNISGNVYRFYEVILYLSVKIIKNDNINYSVSDVFNFAISINYVRFKSFVGVDLIRDVKVYSSNGVNVEYLKLEYIFCIEMMRYYL